jgi:hypothetical protein
MDASRLCLLSRFWIDIFACFCFVDQALEDANKDHDGRRVNLSKKTFDIGYYILRNIVGCSNRHNGGGFLGCHIVFSHIPVHGVLDRITCDSSEQTM